jgi:hypothetical protein
MKKITEEEIQKVLKMLRDSKPEEATRENAIKVIKGMKKMAGVALDKIDEDLKTGKVKVSDVGKVTRED